MQSLQWLNRGAESMLGSAHARDIIIMYAAICSQCGINHIANEMGF